MPTDARALYVSALQNTHAIELQALQIMDRQVERLKNYPEMEAAVAPYRETHRQRERLEEALTGLVEKPCAIKEGFLGIVGNLMALGHTPAQDEILKNAFANQAFENFESPHTARCWSSRRLLASPHTFRRSRCPSTRNSGCQKR